MSSAWHAAPPSQYPNHHRPGIPGQHPAATQDNLARPSTPLGPDRLSPASASVQYHSGATSPTFHDTNPSVGSTPASLLYQPSDLSSDVGDEFFGLNFDNAEAAAPSFLGDNSVPFPDFSDFNFNTAPLDNPLSPNPVAPTSQRTSQTYPPSPEPSLHTVSPPSRRRESAAVGPTSRRATQTQYTPETNGSIDSSDDGIAPNMSTFPPRSPRVTVSMWEREEHPSEGFGYAIPFDSTTALGVGSMGPAITFDQPTSTSVPARDASGRWLPDTSTGQRGLGPTSRPLTETTSPNELAADRVVQERNVNVDSWLTTSRHSTFPQDNMVAGGNQPVIEGVSDREISLGNHTRNFAQPGRTYLRDDANGPLSRDDIDIMLQERKNFGDAPALLAISDADTAARLTQTSSAAMAKFETMCRDNDSVVSRAATWGTRRRSLPSVVDMEGILSGNILKKLSISRGEPSKPAIFFKELRELVRKPSATNLANLKRSLSNQDDDESAAANAPMERRGNLAPPSRTMSWGKRPTPSINTALVGIGSNIAAIGSAAHARSGSISSTTPMMSPKSPFALKVPNQLQRRRAKSDIPPGGGLAAMWREQGGPPVAKLAKPVMVVDQDDDDDDDDDLDDGGMSSDAIKLIDDIKPNFVGFQEHIVKLNPLLSGQNNYLVERIAHQQIVRYKGLLNAKIKHLNTIQYGKCNSGSMCIALGGSAVLLDAKPGLDPVSARLHGSEEDLSTPMEGAIAQDSFPQDIPMPPTNTLPAEFECQLCYQTKKFQKPSDWTKHVHEDVQPFTCTWDRCRDPKIFKRKADWVRHENEGHRHLEWWTCDVEDCHHTCYRRDNFLQHLVREHKFSEPKVKTKAAIKRMGPDPTWQHVEACHVETNVRPQDEPCRFCGKSFPTWKKLTVHLAKHMEQISLPVLRLVARRQLEPDTIISPVQDAPQRPFYSLPPQEYTHQPSPFPGGGGGGGGGAMRPQHNHPRQPPARHSPVHFPVQQPQFDFGLAAASSGGGAAAASSFAAAQVYNPHAAQYDSGLVDRRHHHHPPHIDTTGLDMSHVSMAAFQQTQPSPFLNLPVTTTASFVGLDATQQSSFVATPGMEPFSQMPSMGVVGAQMSFDGGDMMGGTHFTPQGSAAASPYSRSPHRQQGGGFF